jgi:hypothetical protein
MVSQYATPSLRKRFSGKAIIVAFTTVLIDIALQ